MGGTPWTHRERYLENSPIYQFDRIETPLLIDQGANDSRLIASDAIFVALQRLGKRAEYRIYEGEGHVLTTKPNLIAFWTRLFEFLDENLNLSRDDKGRLLFDGALAKPRAAAPLPATAAPSTP